MFDRRVLLKSNLIRRMLVAYVILVAATVPVTFGQTLAKSAATPATAAPTTATFEAADVHASPFTKYPFMDGGDLLGDRYILHQATMTQIVAAAYHLDSDMVQGGPSWLDWDHFDIEAKAPPKTSKEAIRLMLQSLLARDFISVVHNGAAPMPAYVLSAPGGKSKLKESEGSGDPDCDLNLRRRTWPPAPFRRSWLPATTRQWRSLPRMCTTGRAVIWISRW